MKKRVALALGSGGARGNAHIGVIDALVERGYDIVSVSGCSMGAIIGGFYCAGKLDQYRQWACGLGYLDVLRLVDFSLLSSGAIRGDRVFSVLSEMLDGCRIENLDISFTAVATDLRDKKEIWFQRGLLRDAVRASSSIPTVMSPVLLDGRMLVDGGVLNPLPITPCVSAHADHIIAVDLNTDVPMPHDLMNTLAKVQTEKDDWFNVVLDKASNWFGKHSKGAREQADENLGKIEILNQMFEVMQSSLTKFKTAGYPPDLMIKIPTSCCQMYEFYRAEEMIRIGYRIANEALDAYEMGHSSLYGERLR